MKLVYRRFESLPRLAWCAIVRKSTPFVDILCGPWVEAQETFFCDGAWAGPFAEGALDSAHLVGTGAKVTTEGVLFAAPNNTLERIYMVRLADSILVSNSMVFLLAQTNNDVLNGYLSYGAKLASLLAGINRYDRSLPTKNGNNITVFYHCNVLVSQDLEITEQPKTEPREFLNYADYKGFLEEQVGAIFSNAHDSQRQIRHEPIVALSRGYDSSAAASLSWRAGCTEVLTFKESRARGGRIDDDSGEELAGRLGMKAYLYERFAYREMKGFPESENAGGPHVFSAWEDKLQGRLLVTAFLGGSVWDRNCKHVSREIRRTDTGGCLLTEFRLRVGFIHFDVAYLGCTRHPSIHRISNSPEMTPWSVGGDYDKPIARRIVEEVGIPRETFGARKAAVEVSMRVEGLRSVLTQDSLADFTAYCKERWTPIVRLRALGLKAITRLYLTNVYINKRIHGFCKRRFGIKVNPRVLLPKRVRFYACGSFGPEAILFQWSIHKLLPRYRLDE